MRAAFGRDFGHSFVGARAGRCGVRRAVLSAIVASAALAALGTVAACASPREAPTIDAAPVDDGAALARGAEEAGAGDGGDAGDAGAAPSRGVVVRLGAIAQTSVLETPAWPDAPKGEKREKHDKREGDQAEQGDKGGGKRIGYLRHGAVVAAYDRPIVNDGCKEGWYELVAGGFVCGKALLADLQDIKVRLAPKQPDAGAGMPYRYGVNVQEGTPLYRRALSTEERKKYEPWLVPAKPSAEEAAGGEGEKADKGDKSDKSEPADEESAAPARHAKEPATKEAAKDAADAGAPKPKLKDFKGRGVLVRKMGRGFYLGLDREFRSNGARWWRTSYGFAVPHERIMLQSAVTKHVGSWFTEGPATLVGDEGTGGPFDGGLFDGGLFDGGLFDGGLFDASSSSANVSDASSANGAGAGSAEGGAAAALDGGAPTSLAGVVAFAHVGFARKIELAPDGKKVVWGPELPKRSTVMLTGRSALVGGQTYHEATAGFWVRLMDVTQARLAPPADLGAHEKWIDVDLTRQLLVALEGTRPVFATLISSGRRNPGDKEHDFPTPTGSFRVREKHVTTTMDGDVASDGPYSIEDVPWVMYFQGSYALHGAFWHDAFGHVRSHGCVNMAPEDARTLFAWTEPPLPAGWHGVFSRDDASGTRIIIHDDRSLAKRAAP